ncbi:calcium/proton exchanger [Capsulimonas corticalis]|uniref:Ca(2+)/H(+) antiporter n=1 Tax=Capsulimonas corticalis TaxID=2219043 RepID=A0A402CT25_9BACT|nr:calcium/proton exchanger [Capsulimonas corticalis]BDI30877.1 calcium/proton exchanger [Capsulimonas corticalis]
MTTISSRDRTIALVAVAATIASGIAISVHANPVLLFVITAVALAMLASMVGSATEQLGGKLGPGATGVLQSALGNLPELFICIFALRQGLVTVVQSALIGSILANSLLVLGLAFLAGGLKNGAQKFGKQQPRMIASLMLLAVSGLMIPTLAHTLHTAAGRHPDTLSIAAAIVLLIVFLVSLPVSIKGGPLTPADCEPCAEETPDAWPMWLSIVTLLAAGVGAAFVSDWFVEALKPAIRILHLSEAFTGLVLVAIAGNAVENVVGIQLAIKNRMDFAVSVILNSSLQVSLGLIPVLVLLSFFLGGAHLTLVLTPLLIAVLALAAIVTTVVVYDGESIWLEGAALIGLYVIIAAAFWWG